MRLCNSLSVAANDSSAQEAHPHRTFGQRALKAGLFVLFSAILVIPRIRRLRRRPWAWSGVRLAVAGCAAWLGWRYKHADAGVPTLILSLILFAFSLLVRAKPEEKSIDVLARELNALIVLNGGAFRQSPDSPPVAKAQILVFPERILVFGPKERELLEIHLAKVRNIAVKQIDAEQGKDWAVEISWLGNEPCVTLFEYDGFFAEHLAQVTESTVRSQWKKELPVLQ